MLEVRVVTASSSSTRTRAARPVQHRAVSCSRRNRARAAAEALHPAPSVVHVRRMLLLRWTVWRIFLMSATLRCLKFKKIGDLLSDESKKVLKSSETFFDHCADSFKSTTRSRSRLTMTSRMTSRSRRRSTPRISSVPLILFPTCR